MADELQDPTQPPDVQQVPEETQAPAAPAPWKSDIESQPGFSAQSVPSWADISASDDFQNATPENRLVAFDRWHNLAYNTAKAAPNWSEFKDEFNNTAFQTQQKLSEEAGGLDPHMARLKLANEVAQQGDTPEAKKALVSTLGDDVAKDWEAPPTMSQQLMRPLNSFGNAFARGLGETMKAAGYVGDTAYDAITGEHGHSFIGQLGEQLTSRADQLDQALDPRTAGGITDVVPAAAGGLLEFLGETAIGGEALKGIAAARAVQLGLKGEAAAAATKKLAGKLGAMAVFGVHNGEQGMEQAKRAGVSQGKILETFLADTAVGAGAAALTPAGKWLERIDGATNGGITNAIKRATLEGGQFAGQMFAQQLGSNVVAKTVLASDDGLLKDTFDQAKSGGVTGVVASLVLSALAHGKPLGAKPTAGGADAAKLQAAGMPESADVARKAEAVGQGPSAGPVGAPSAEPVEVTISRGQPALSIKPEATPDDLTAMRKTVAGFPGLDDNQKLVLNEQIDTALKSRGVEAPPSAEGLTKVEEKEVPASDVAVAAVGEQQKKEAVAPEAAAPEAAPLETGTENFTPREKKLLADLQPIQEQYAKGELTKAQRDEASKKVYEAHNAKTDDQINAELQAASGEATPTTPVAAPAEPKVSIKEGVVTEDEAKRIAKLEETNKKAIAEGLGPPSERQVAREGAIPKTAEEKATRAVEGEQAVKDLSTQEGVVLSRSEIAKAIGGPPNSKEVTRILGEMQSTHEAKYPAETVPAGAKENEPIGKPEETYAAARAEIDEQRAELNKKLEDLRNKRGKELTLDDYQLAKDNVNKELGDLHVREKALSEASVAPDVHPVTREHLPTVTEEDGTVRPKFTNDPNITAQQMDVGLFDTTKKRMYLPDELVDADKINPNIHFTYDKAAGKYYVTAVDAVIPFHAEESGKLKSVYARVKEAGDFTEQYKARATREEANKEVLVGGMDTLDFLANENKERQARGDEPLDMQDIVSLRQPEEGDVLYNPAEAESTIGESNFTKEALAPQHADLLRKLGFFDEKNQGDRLKAVLEGIRDGKDGRANQYEREVAKLILRSGLDTKNVPLKLNTEMSSAGLYHHTRTENFLAGAKWAAYIELNPDVLHRGGTYADPARGLITSILHESYHAVTLAKLRPDYRYKLNKAEQVAVQNLEKIRHVATVEALSHILKRKPTQVEINRFVDLVGNTKLKEDLSNPVDAALEKNPYFRAHSYGFSNLVEFAAELQANPNFTSLLQRMPALSSVGHPTGGGVIKPLLQAFKDWMKQLFTGRSLEEGSLSYQALEHVQNLAREAQKPELIGKATPSESAATFGAPKKLTPDEATRMEIAPPEEKAAATPLEQDLFRLAKAGKLTPEYIKMATRRLKAEVSVDVLKERERLGAKTSEPQDLKANPAAIQADGWMTPDGRFVPNVEGGAHDETILKHLAAEDPTLFKEVGGRKEKNGSVSIGVEEQENLHQKAVDAGYVRVVGARPGGTVLLDGQPTPEQRRLIRGAAQAQGSDVKMDVGPSSRTFATTPAAIPQPNPEPTVHLEQKLTKDGKVAHDIKWDENTTRGELVAFSEKLNTDPNVNDFDKRRIKQQIAEALGPTITMKQGKDLYAGYDSSNNIANAEGRQARNDVIKLDKYGNPEKLTKEQRMDLDSAPFVIEAGGNREQMAADLAKVRDSSKLPEEEKQIWVPVLERALAKFDELNGKKENYQKIVSDQLMGERANGVPTGKVDDYVTHLLEKTENKNFFTNLGELGEGGGTVGSRYFIKGRYFKTLADALANGYVPKSDAEGIVRKSGLVPFMKRLQSGDEGFASNLADLTQRRIEVGQRLVRTKAFEDSLKATKLEDGRTIIAPMEEYQNFAGQEGYKRIPKGYEMVTTGIKPLVVAKEFVPMFNALYGRSALDGNKYLRFLKEGTGFLKRNTLMFDSYHVGRILFKELAFGGKNRFGYNRGLSLLEYSPETMDAMRKDGEINQGQFDWYHENRAAAKELMDAGLNAGKVSDNLVAAHSAAIPFIKNFNPWVFQKLSRGAMLQAALDNFKRNLSRFPELGREGAARRTAKEMNEVFGNLQNQSFFRSKTFQDINRVVALAPQWAESQLMAELRGYGQLAKVPFDLARGKARLGTVAQGNLNIVLGMLAAGQVMNYLSTGHSTFENKGEHKLDAYIPAVDLDGKQHPGKGFWFNPFEIGGEYAMMAQRYFAQHMTPIDVMTRIASNKLGPLGRGLTELGTGRDYAGRKFESTTDRVRGALSDILPLPIASTSVIERDPRQALGFRMSRQPGSVEKQALQSMGLKLAPEMTPRSETFALAYPFREDKSYSDRASEYREMRRALDTDQMDAAETEVRMLVDRGHTWDQIRAGAGISRGGSITTERFTGGTTSREKEFVRSLTPEQKEIYDQAQRDHVANAKKLRDLLTQLRPELRDKLKANDRAHQGKAPLE